MPLPAPSCRAQSAACHRPPLLLSSERGERGGAGPGPHRCCNPSTSNLRGGGGMRGRGRTGAGVLPRLLARVRPAALRPALVQAVAVHTLGLGRALRLARAPAGPPAGAPAGPPACPQQQQLVAAPLVAGLVHAVLAGLQAEADMRCMSGALCDMHPPPAQLATPCWMDAGPPKQKLLSTVRNRTIVHQRTPELSACTVGRGIQQERTAAPPRPPAWRSRHTGASSGAQSLHHCVDGSSNKHNRNCQRTHKVVHHSSQHPIG